MCHSAPTLSWLRMTGVLGPLPPESQPRLGRRPVPAAQVASPGTSAGLCRLTAGCRPKAFPPREGRLFQAWSCSGRTSLPKISFCPSFSYTFFSIHFRRTSYNTSRNKNSLSVIQKTTFPQNQICLAFPNQPFLIIFLSLGTSWILPGTEV